MNADDSTSIGSESAKRRQPDSVVTLPGHPPTKKGRGTGLPADGGWLRGEMDRASVKERSRGVKARCGGGWRAMGGGCYAVSWRARSRSGPSQALVSAGGTLSAMVAASSGEKHKKEEM